MLGAMLERTRRFDYLSRFSALMMAVFLAAVIVQAGMIFDLFWEMATTTALVVQLAFVLYYLVNVVGRFNWGVVFLGLVLLAYLIFGQLLFARNAGGGMNLNAVLSYLPILSFLPLCRSTVPMQRILRIFAALVTTYLCIYVFTHDFLVSGQLGENRSVHSGDAERGTRLYLAGAFASYVTFLAVMDARLGMVKRLAMIAISLAAIWLSGSRTFQALFILVLLLAMLRMLGIWTRLAIFGVFLAISIALLLGVLIPGWNPFLLVATDGSGYARSLEYYYAVEAIRGHWLLGIGIASSFSALQAYVGTPMYEPLYVTDLGVMGPFIMFGLPGLLAFIAATYFCIVTPFRGLSAPELRALRLNCILCGISGIITPSILLEQNVLFLGFLFAASVRNRRLGIDPRAAGHPAHLGIWFRTLAPRLQAGIWNRLNVLGKRRQRRLPAPSREI